MSNQKKRELASYMRLINSQSDYGAWIGDIFIGIGLGVLACIINIFFIDVMCGGEVSNGIFLLLAIVWPIVLAVGWPLWNVITQNRSIRRVRKGLELCIEHATTNEQLIESDRYFLRLLR